MPTVLQLFTFTFQPSHTTAPALPPTYSPIPHPKPMVGFHSSLFPPTSPPTTSSSSSKLDHYSAILEELLTTVEPLESELSRLRRRQAWKRREKDPDHVEWVIQQVERDLAQLKERLEWYEGKVEEMWCLVRRGKVVEVEVREAPVKGSGLCGARGKVSRGR